MDEQFHSQVKHHPMFPVLLAVLIIFFALAAVYLIAASINKFKATSFIGRNIDVKNTINITGTGEAYAKPDLAIVDFSVVNTGTTVDAALTKNTQAMNKVIEYIKSQGVEDKDLKTTSFNIYPQYEYQRVQIEIYPYPPGKRVLTGYEVSQQLQVKIRDLAKVGNIIQGAASNGANQIGDLQFTIDKLEDIQKQAREDAINEAKDKANILASQLGVKIVGVVNFSENGYVPYYQEKRLDTMAVGSPGSPAPSPNIQTGENKITSTVTITYEIQ